LTTLFVISGIAEHPKAASHHKNHILRVVEPSTTP
jgi:hypothetical protein